MLLLALQQGDSAFPSGGFAFSWGLEELIADATITSSADLAGCLRSALRDRWNDFDRVVLARTHAADDARAVAEIDREVEMMVWSAPMRAGSKRAGRALLGVHAKLGVHAAAGYRALVGQDDELGHLAVAQGLVWRAAGLDLAACEALSAWALIQGIAGAAVRLGLIGHLEAQAIIGAGRGEAAALLGRAIAPDQPLASFTPVVDIASIHHGRRGGRLFAT